MAAGGTGFLYLKCSSPNTNPQNTIYTQDLKTTKGSMLIPIILGSDKTTVSVATGNNEYYPLYISIGNIYNKTHRARRSSVALIGFLAIPKSKPCVSSPHNAYLIPSQLRKNSRLMHDFGN